MIPTTSTPYNVGPEAWDDIDEPARSIWAWLWGVVAWMAA